MDLGDRQPNLKAAKHYSLGVPVGTIDDVSTDDVVGWSVTKMIASSLRILKCAGSMTLLWRATTTGLGCSN